MRWILGISPKRVGNACFSGCGMRCGKVESSPQIPKLRTATAHKGQNSSPSKFAQHREKTCRRWKFCMQREKSGRKGVEMNVYTKKHSGYKTRMPAVEYNCYGNKPTADRLYGKDEWISTGHAAGLRSKLIFRVPQMRA